MMRKLRYGAFTAFVVLIRAPLMFPLLALYWAGRRAERALDWLTERLPGL